MSATTQVDKLVGLIPCLPNWSKPRDPFSRDGATEDLCQLLAERLSSILLREIQGPGDLTCTRRALLGLAPLFRHGAWETRRTAAACLENVASVAHGLGLHNSDGDVGKRSLTLAMIDIHQITSLGTLLLSRAPAGLIAELEKGGIEVRMDRQRKQLLRCIGLAADGDNADANFYGGVAALITADDLSRNNSQREAAASQGADLKREEESESAEESSRIRNQKKRRAAEMLKGKTRRRRTRTAQSMSSEASAECMSFLGRGGFDDGSKVGGTLACADGSSSYSDLLRLLYNDLCFQLFDQAWECRHGAALALLSMLRGRGTNHHTTWPSELLEDVAARCICVLALDRFGDYSASGVVAPVRETVAQVLGLATGGIDSSLLEAICSKLQELTEHPDWEVRHGGVCGLLTVTTVVLRKSGGGIGVGDKAFVACRNEVIGASWLIGKRGLDDLEEEVCAVSARLLRNIVESGAPPEPLLNKGRKRKKKTVAKPLVDGIWQALDEVSSDVISSCIGDILQLVVACCNSEVGFASSLLESGSSLARILSLWDSDNASVRCSCAKVLVKVLEESRSEMESSTLIAIARRAFSGALGDSNASAWQSCLRVMEACGKLSLSNKDAEESTEEEEEEEEEHLNELMQMYFPLAVDANLMKLDDAASDGGCLFSLDHSSRKRSRNALLSLLPHNFVCDKALAYIKSSWAYHREGSFMLLECMPPPSSVTAAAIENFARKQMSSSLPLDCTKIDSTSLPYSELSRICKALEASRTEALRNLLLDVNGEGHDFWEKKTIHLEKLLLKGLKEWHRRASCAACMSLVRVQGDAPLPPLNQILRPFMEAIKFEECESRHSTACDDLSFIIQYLDRRHCGNAAACLSKCTEALPKAIDKLLTNLNNFLCDHSDSTKRSRVGAQRIFTQVFRDAIDCGLVARWFDMRLALLSERSNGSAGSSQTSLLSTIELLPLLTVNLEAEKSALVSDELVENLVRAARCPPPPMPNTPNLADLVRKASCTAISSIFTLCPVRVWAGIRKFFLLDIFTRDALADANFLKALLDSASRHLIIHAPEMVPCVLRGTTHANPLVREVLVGTMATIVGLAALADLDLDNFPGRHNDSLERDGQLVYRHLVRGEPLCCLGPDSLPPSLKRALGLDTVPPRILLRPYQWEGIAWLDFLRRVGAHGILADEMGLGKTLQALISVAMAFLEGGMKLEGNISSPPALVVCPPTLMSLWAKEAQERFGFFFRPTLLIGAPSARREVLDSILDKAWQGGAKAEGRFPLVIASYTTLRSDIELLAPIQWTSVVMDEAHLLRNPTTKLSLASRMLKSPHRIALTGTPIQNTVIELWSIFEFTMPGYLGTQSDFAKNFADPAAAALGHTLDAPAAVEGFSALEKLHRLVLPFVLRREKSKVLKELPPKLIMDVACEMPPAQRDLYDSLCRAEEAASAVRAVRDSLQESSASGGTANASLIPPAGALRWLNVMQRLCVHPALAIPNDDPRLAEMRQKLLDSETASGKLQSLKQLLWSSGVGMADFSEAGDEAGDSSGAPAAASSTPKILLFAQRKASLDVVESCLLRRHMPSITYLRMDGNTPPSKRSKIVAEFQEDDSIPLFLLTTRIGGLGLNLSVADTVIFLEHDWNPRADLQAMDRAHRLGQQRCVSVYRLITADSIEERIMALQAHKLRTSEAVINTDNSSLFSMDTSDVLDLFEKTTEAASDPSKQEARNGAKQKGPDVFADLSWSMGDYDYLSTESFESTLT